MSIDLAKLKALAAEATDGPWEHDHDEGPSWDISVKGKPDLVAEHVYEADAAFIAALVNAFPELCARLEAAEVVVEAAMQLERRGVIMMDTHGADMHFFETLSAYRRLTEEPKP